MPQGTVVLDPPPSQTGPTDMLVQTVGRARQDVLTAMGLRMVPGALQQAQQTKMELCSVRRREAGCSSLRDEFGAAGLRLLDLNALNPPSMTGQGVGNVFLWGILH